MVTRHAAPALARSATPLDVSPRRLTPPSTTRRWGRGARECAWKWATSPPPIYARLMIERRNKRSEDREEALQFLMEALADRSPEVAAVALIDGAGKIVAGTGMPQELVGLAKIAGPLARGEAAPEFDEVTEGTDLLMRDFKVGEDAFVLAALGTRVRRMHDCVRGVSRILS